MYLVDKSKTYRDLQKVIEGTIRGTTKKNLTNALKNNSKKYMLVFWIVLILSDTPLRRPSSAHSELTKTIGLPFMVCFSPFLIMPVVFEFYKDLNYLFCIVMDDCKPDKCPKMTASHAYSLSLLPDSLGTNTCGSAKLE